MGALTEGGAIPEHDCTPPARSSVVKFTKLGKDPVAQWLRCCATNRKVAGWNFSLTKSFLSYYSPGVDSASNRNEYQEYFLGVKVAGA